MSLAHPSFTGNASKAQKWQEIKEEKHTLHYHDYFLHHHLKKKIHMYLRFYTCVIQYVHVILPTAEQLLLSSL